MAEAETRESLESVLWQLCPPCRGWCAAGPLGGMPMAHMREHIMPI